MFADLWPGFDTSEVPITSVTNGVHAPTWMAREILDIAEREVGSSALEEGSGWDAIDKVGDSELWRVRNLLRARLVDEIRRRMRESNLVTRDERGRARLDRLGVRPRRPDDRFRPPRPVLQAVDADAARPRPAARAAARPRPPGADRDRRQEPPGRRRRQAAHRADGAVRRRSRGAAPHHVPARLRHRHGALPVLGCRRLAEQPAASARGLRHVGHEGGAERRAQPVDPGRVVGRVVRRRERLGDPVGRGPDRPRPARRPRGPRAVRPDREERRDPVLRPPRAASRPGGCRWCGTR